MVVFSQIEKSLVVHPSPADREYKEGSENNNGNIGEAEEYAYKYQARQEDVR